MKHLNSWLWSDVVRNTAACLQWRSHYIHVNTYQGNVADRHKVDRDWNSLGLPPLVDESVFTTSMTAIQSGFTRVWIFEEDDPDDREKFREWPRAYMPGRFVKVHFDGSHGEANFYAAMFRDDTASQRQAMIFKLNEM